MRSGTGSCRTRVRPAAATGMRRRSAPSLIPQNSISASSPTTVPLAMHGGEGLLDLWLWPCRNCGARHRGRKDPPSSQGRDIMSFAATRYRLLLSAIAALMVIIQVAAARADDIKIGVLGSFSGPYASWGQHFQQAVDLWLEQHKGQVGAHKLSVLYRDVGGANPQRAKQLAQELVVRDQVNYLAGLEFTPTGLAVAEVIDPAKMPFVMFNSGTSIVTRKPPFYIRTAFTQWSVAVPEAHWAIEQGKKRAVIISADFAPGYDAIDSYTQGFTEKG